MKALRILLRIVKWLLIILLLPIGIWWICNSIDESPTQEARRWTAPFEHTLTDKENGWLYLIGIGAAPDEDPIAFGRRRVDAYEARVNQKLQSLIGDEEKALFKDPIPFKGPDPAADGVDALCNPSEANCLDWAFIHRDLLGRLGNENAIRLQRYEALLGMTRFDELYTPSSDEHYPNFYDDVLYFNLIARDAAKENADFLQSSAKIARMAIFWQRVGEQAHSMLLKNNSDIFLDRYRHLLDLIVDRCSEDQLNALQTNIDAILRAPNAAQRDMGSTIRYETLLFSHEMHKVFPGRIQLIKNCCQDTINDPLFPYENRILMIQAYLSQATLNFYSKFSTEVAKFSAIDPRHFRTAERRFQIASNKYDLINTSSSLHALTYNGVGKSLVVASVPTKKAHRVEWAKRQHDREALRRMFFLKVSAKERGIKSDDMPAFLLEQSPSLRNPYTNKRFGWDSVQHEITFEPMATKYWKRSRLNVALPVPYAYHIDECDAPMEIQVRKIDASKTVTAYNFVACGFGGMGQLLGGVEDNQEFEERFAHMFAYMRFTQADGFLDVRLQLHDGNRLRNYEALRVAPGAAETRLQRAGHDGGPEFTVSFDRIINPALMSIMVKNSAAKQIAGDIAKVKHIDLRHLDLVSGKSRLTLDFDAISIKDALTLIAEVSDIELHQISDEVYSFEPIATKKMQ